MISDDAKTFMTASRRLRALFQLPEVRNHMELKHIKCPLIDLRHRGKEDSSSGL